MSVHPIHPENAFPPHMTATTWQHRLDVAYSTQDVVNVARDFLATFSPVDLHSLPAPCQPPRKLFEEDLATYAVDLVRHECTTPETEELIHTLARFFSHASTRLSQLSARNRHDDELQRQQSA